HHAPVEGLHAHPAAKPEAVDLADHEFGEAAGAAGIFLVGGVALDLDIDAGAGEGQDHLGEFGEDGNPAAVDRLLVGEAFGVAAAGPDASDVKAPDLGEA